MKTDDQLIERLDRVEALLVELRDLHQELVEKLNDRDLPGRDYSVERWED